MKNIKLEVRVADKKLFVNGESIKLDSSLFNAKSSTTSDNEDLLELKYGNREPGFIYDEAGDIDTYFRKTQFYDKVEISPCEEVDSPTVAIVGEFDVAIYH
jgi:hypothetical protein